jgi:predicted RNase H-like HicB family nuclease
MKDFRISLRIVFYQEDGVWLAHCLEFDLLGDGESRREALESLVEAIHLQIEESLRSNNLANLFTPASGELFELFSAAEDSEPHAWFDFHSLSNAYIHIESAQIREYCGDPAESFLTSS